MEFKEILLRELIKTGYSELEDSRRVWDISNRCLLYSTPELASFFLKARNHPRYVKTIIEIETDLLKKQAGDFGKGFTDEKCNVIDLGAVDGLKAKAFFGSIGKGEFRYCSASPNETLNELSIRNVKTANLKNVIDFCSHSLHYAKIGDCLGILRNGAFQKNLILFLETQLAAFEIHSVLFEISQAMFRGDGIIIGNGIRVGERFANLQTYKSPLFKEWFFHLIKELGFEEEDVEYDVRFANGRVEGFFRLNYSKTVNSGEQGVELNKGDELVVSVLYKYYESELLRFCKMYFREVKLVKDSENEYALIFCKK